MGLPYDSIHIMRILVCDFFASLVPLLPFPHVFSDWYPPCGPTDDIFEYLDAELNSIVLYALLHGTYCFSKV